MTLNASIPHGQFRGDELEPGTFHQRESHHPLDMETPPLGPIPSPAPGQIQDPSEVEGEDETARNLAALLGDYGTCH